MAIDRSVGGMKQYLFNLTTSNRYNQLRFKLSRMLFKLGILNEERRKALIRFGNSLKSMAAQQQNIFEGMNIRYFGPIDGHDVKNLARVLRDIKDMQGPKILHLHTIKGKGFGPAEKHATEWHAPGKFDPVTGERFIANTEGMPPLFQDVFGNTLVELAEANPKIVGVTPAMPSGCSMNILMEKMPKRAFDVGIAEGHAVTFSGGMAKDGLQPFCNIYSSFMQRAHDNIIHDVAIQNLPVVLCLDRAGLVGEDGPTHQPIETTMALRLIPNVSVIRPADALETATAWQQACLNKHKPTCLLLSRQKLTVLHDYAATIHENAHKGAYVLSPAKNEAKAVLIGTGSEVHLALAAQAKLAEEGIDVSVVSMPCWDAFDAQSDEYKESVLPAGVTKFAVEAGVPYGWSRYTGTEKNVLGITTFGASAPGDVMMEKYGFTVENLVAKVKAAL